LFGAALAYWLLWHSHGLRILAWALALLGAVSQTILLVSASRSSVRNNLPALAAGLAVIVFLLLVGWWGRTPEKSRAIYVALLVMKAIVLFFAGGFLLLRRAGLH
jgi:hypothetical protein